LSRAPGPTRLPRTAIWGCGSGRRRQPVASHHAVVVETHHLDHVIDVGPVLDPARGRPLLLGEDRMMGDPALISEIAPDGLWTEEVGGVVAVQVTDLVGADLEREFTPSSRAHRPQPGGDRQ
jgi:hypothetical protein